MSNAAPPTVVIDDTIVHYNTSRDAGTAIAPSKVVSDSVSSAERSPWNNTLAVITSPISIWYNVTGYSRIAVYGALIPPSNLGVTAWANYTINGNYTAANITTSTQIITDFPLFTSVELDPNQQYNLTADIWASPDAPYLFDYLLAFSPPDPTPVFASTTASSTSTASPSSTGAQSSNLVNVPHPITIIGALAGACALLLALWLVTLCCWCRSRGSKPNTFEESMGPEPPFDPRPSVSKSATLVSPKASRRADSFLERPLQTSSSTLVPTPRLSLVPEYPPAPSSVASTSRPATTYVPEHGQFTAPTHIRSATLPTLPTLRHFPPPAPSAMMMRESSMYEGVQQRPVIPQHMLPHAASMPRLGAATALQFPAPFEHPPAGQILRAESPLHNPYDDLYGYLDTPTPVPAGASGSSTPTGTSTRSRSRSPAPAPLAVPTSTSTPAPAPATATALPAALSGTTRSGPSTSAAPTTSASAPAPQPESTTAAPTPTPTPTPPTGSQWGPNEYPPERKQEVRLEPPRGGASASSLEREDFADADCPPAYSS